jgi:hypothetical protein
MLFRVGIENNYEGRSIAWALNHPGCFAYGATGDQARQNLPAAIQWYIDWIAGHDPQPWLAAGTYDIQVEETWEVFQINEDFELAEKGYEVNAWFRHDWKPLAEEEVVHEWVHKYSNKPAGPRRGRRGSQRTPAGPRRGRRGSN